VAGAVIEEGEAPSRTASAATGERAIATLKTWKILAELRCRSRRATAVVQAILVLHHVETNRYAA
jgi:hypothetical protein